MVLHLVLFCLCIVHLYLFWRQTCFLNKNASQNISLAQKKRILITLVNHLFDIFWCALLIEGNWAQTVYQAAVLTISYLLIKKICLSLVQQATGTALQWRLWKAWFPGFILNTLVIGAVALGLNTMGQQPALFIFGTLWVFWFIKDSLQTFVKPLFSSQKQHDASPCEDPSLQKKMDELVKLCAVRPLPMSIHHSSPPSANAGIEGFSRAQRLTIQAPLLAILNKAELLCVIAHELGHVHHKHILKYQLFKGGLSIAALMIFLHFSSSLTTLVIMAPLLVSLCPPLLNSFKRACEYQADQFVQKMSDPVIFINALEKIHHFNNSFNKADPLYAFVYYGHPPFDKRKAKLMEKINGTAKMHLARS